MALKYQAQQQSVENMLNFCTKIHMYMVHILLTNHEEYLNFYLEIYKVYIYFLSWITQDCLYPLKLSRVKVRGPLF